MLKRNEVSGELFDLCQRFNVAPGDKTLKQMKKLEAVGKAKGLAGMCDPKMLLILMTVNDDSFDEPMPRPAPPEKKPEAAKPPEEKPKEQTTK